LDQYVEYAGERAALFHARGLLVFFLVFFAKFVLHCIFARSEKGMGEGKNGLPGAFWFDLDKILATITEDDLKQKLQAFDQAQHRRRATRRPPPRSSARRPGWPPRRRKADIK
jgi:hypothetical protein